MGIILDLLLDPTPASHVRIVLREYRTRGAGFEFAWAQALRSLPRNNPEVEEWRDTLHGHKEHWRDCYESAPMGAPSDLFVMAQ
jgi:hypothetical protein